MVRSDIQSICAAVNFSAQNGRKERVDSFKLFSSKMKFLVAFLLIFSAKSLIAADFDNTSLRWQLYISTIPYHTMEFTDTSGTHEMTTTPPASIGLAFNPLLTPIFKADVPFYMWLGAELGEFYTGEVLSNPNIGETPEKIEITHFRPSAIGGFGFNLVGPLDLEIGGGAGLSNYRYDHTFGVSSKRMNESVLQYWAQGGLEYSLTEFKRSFSLKLGLYVRQDFVKIKDHQSVEFVDTTVQVEGIVPKYNGLIFDEITSGPLPVKIGAKLTLDFGRESRTERHVRHKMYSRDDELKRMNKDIKPLDDWDCMAIERDYKFYIDSDGTLPDMRAKFNRTEYVDILETYLVHCSAEDLTTKLKLYRQLDSSKIALKRYQSSQEDRRYQQVMASNDVSFLKMYLQYYPDSPRRAAVESKLKVLSDYKDFTKAKEANTFKSYLWYLTEYPEGKYRKEAETGIWELVKEANRIKDYDIYMKKFPDGLFINEAKRAKHQLLRRQN